LYIRSFVVKNLVATEEEMYVSDGEVDEQDNDARYLGTSLLSDINIFSVLDKTAVLKQPIKSVVNYPS
jgi:hypothetical protein